jgi:hypothetical protein
MEADPGYTAYFRSQDASKNQRREMNSKRSLLTISAALLSMVILACSQGEILSLVITPTPTLTPLPTTTPTATPDPLSPVGLAKIALQESDLQVAGNITRQVNDPPAAEPGVVNYFSVSYSWSDSQNTTINVLRVFETESYAKDFFQNDTKSIKPDELLSIPPLGDQAAAVKFEVGTIQTVMIVWRYKNTYAFLFYSSQTDTMDNMIEQSVRIAQKIDTRLRMAIP